MRQKKAKTIQFSEFEKHFTDQVNSADLARGDSLLRLQTIRSKRQNSQRRQLNRLVTKYGEKHPKVEGLAERIINEKEMENFLSVSISKTKLEAEIVKGSFKIQGRVLGDDMKGVSGIAVQLQDTKNNPVGRTVKTSKDGGYTVIVDVDSNVKTVKLGLVILDKKGTRIHREKLPVLMTVGAVELRDVVLAKINTTPRNRSTLIKKAIAGREPVLKPAVVANKVLAKKITKKARTKRVALKKVVSKKKTTLLKKTKIAKKKKVKIYKKKTNRKSKKRKTE